MLMTKRRNNILVKVMNISSFSTLNSLARQPIYLSCGNAYALAAFLAGTEHQGYEKRINDEWIVVSLGKDERPKLP